MTIFSAPATPPPGADGPAEELASRWRRFFAAFADLILLFAAPFSVAIIVAVMAVFAGSALLLLVFLGLLIAPYVVEALATGLRGQTPGKFLLGIRVVNATNGQVPGMGMAAVRTLVKYLPGAVFALAGLIVVAWILWDPMRQGLHDKAAATVVIRTR